ncbi:HEAT repeat domain-containing protein [Natronosalvus halobius]|uniref:HEAT repeat domain-containing protein n=1 Tax=Natronosalvus halobius TaxID=2953746 RepID=UPI00209FE6BB|nr:HEAT repeat domain-containing protein [Natronosalvus halobius]USZ72414.1 HEAT repeat domain-containing protein [Natronosalvus halobius]
MSPKDRRERAEAIRTAVESNPETVDVDELADLLVSESRKARQTAFEAYRTLVSDRPAVADDVGARLESHLTDDAADVRERAALTSAAFADKHPDVVDGLVHALRSIGTDPAEPGREAAIVAIAKLAHVRPASIVPAVDALVAICDDPVSAPTTGRDERGGPVGKSDAAALQPERERRDQARLHAIAALTLLAADDPAAVRSDVPSIASLLQDDHHLIRAGACEVLEDLATAYPTSVEPFASELAERAATDTKHPVPWRAADALVALDAERPECVGEAVAPFASDLSRFLESSDVDRRRAGVALVADAALARPESLESMRPTLRDLLSDDDASVRMNAVISLGAAGTESDRSTIADLADSDPDERVRKTATRVHGRFDGSLDSE